MLSSTTVRSTKKGKERLNEAITLAGLTPTNLEKKLEVKIGGASDALKRLRGTKSKSDDEPVNKSVVKLVCDLINEEYRNNNKDKVLKPSWQTALIMPTDIVGFQAWYGSELIPSEFQALIDNKTKEFYGRLFVFEDFENFMKNNPNGYYTVVGHPGMGKSAIAAKYVADHKSICYFNILVQGNNTPEQFLNSGRGQLINRYGLHDAGDANLSTLLAKVSRELSSTDERLVIVVDALDEVKQDSDQGKNILDLPTTLPNRVYFLLTRRPYQPDREGLTLDAEVPRKVLDLTKSVDFSRKDVEGYIRLRVNEDSDDGKKIRRWIQDRSIPSEEFVKQLRDKSQENFMYLVYVFKDIVKGVYNDVTLNQFPDGLEEYYQTHWQRMGMDDAPSKMIILYILVAVHMPVTAEMIAKIANQEKYEVQNFLNEWINYLPRSEVEGKIKYSFYHTSFLDYLKGKRQELEPDRRIFQEANQRLNNYLRSEMM